MLCALLAAHTTANDNAPRRSTPGTCADAWNFEQGEVNMTTSNDGLCVEIQPCSPAGAVVQQAYLLTNGEQGKDGCPTFEATPKGGLKMQVPPGKFQHCMPTGDGDAGQTFAARVRILTFPARKACQSGTFTDDQPFGWAFTKETVCGEGTLEGDSTAVLPFHVPVEISCGKVKRSACMLVLRCALACVCRSS